MNYLEAIVLGIIQGLTEFLPVSSSGHLELGKALFGSSVLPQESITFTVVLHFATALSTLVIFRKEVVQILTGLMQFKWNEESKFSMKIVISMIPAAAVGVFFEGEFEMFFSGQVVLVGLMLIITALLLLFADKAAKTNKTVSYFNAFVIGVTQALAIMPGISRSGATIASSVLLGVDRTKAARFSFLMVVPLIFGKIMKDISSGHIDFQNDQISLLGAGFIAAFVAGLFACKWMISVVRNSKLSYFALYCFLIGVISIVLTVIEF
jgi:undecaprenyl-diphosphatase